jgi:hypothetical protein
MISATGCLLLVEEGHAEVVIEPHVTADTTRGAPVAAKAVDMSTRLGALLLRRETPRAAASSEQGSDDDGEVECTAERRLIGPGFLCYCPPPGIRGSETIPVSLRNLPRCSSVVSVPAGKFIATRVPGHDLNELLRQPGMGPLRAYISEKSTEKTYDAVTPLAK